VDLTPEEVRVLGALIEKQRTTPDQYPLSLNALRLACNQSTNRDPVEEQGEAEPTLEDRVARLESEVERLKSAVQAADSAVKPHA
jgi:uncharacterized protein YceH (UPF0502 family)